MQGVQLPTGYYIGASATTGDLSDNHDIISVRLFELDLPDDVSFSYITYLRIPATSNVFSHVLQKTDHTFYHQPPILNLLEIM